MPIKVSNFLNTTIFSDIDPNFTKNPKSGDLLLLKDEQSIRRSISNLLNTSFGERLFQPRLGGSLRNLLFEPIDAITTLEIKDRIYDTIRNHEPRVDRIDVDVVANNDENYYTVSVEFSIRAIGRVDRLSVVLERIR